jgi:hypothetical protein
LFSKTKDLFASDEQVFSNLVRQLAGNSSETALAPLALRRHLSVTLPFSIVQAFYT